MTGSIIRRYARYHGCFSAGHDERKTELERIKEIQKARKYESCERGRIVIVEQLTLIEAAEVLIEDGKGSFSNDHVNGYHDAAASIGRGLLVRAGIDPERWAKVTG